MTDRRVLVHVGTQKTGTTSIQTFLRDENDGLLAAAGAHYPPGFLLPEVHTELPLLCIRPDRTWPARLRFPETSRASWAAAASEHVRAQVESQPHAQLVYVHEDLSYLRFADEFDRLRALLAGREVHIVIVLRERSAFLRSYRAQLDGTGFEPSRDPASFAYTAEDSWLVDYDSLVDGYRAAFGAGDVTVLDYDELVDVDGSVIPRFAELLGIPRSSLPSLTQYRLNQSGRHIFLSEQQRDAIREDLDRRFP